MKLNEITTAPLKPKSDTSTSTPPAPRYHVILFNDDYSPAEFVAHLLAKHFHLSGDVAWQIMVKIHRDGMGIIGTYGKDIAETKAAAANAEAQAEGHPTHFEAEPEY